jgi:hypothetical protein
MPKEKEVLIVTSVGEFKEKFIYGDDGKWHGDFEAKKDLVLQSIIYTATVTDNRKIRMVAGESLEIRLADKTYEEI